MSDDLLKIVGDYADQLLAADELAAHDSMTVAEAVRKIEPDLLPEAAVA